MKRPTDRQVWEKYGKEADRQVREEDEKASWQKGSGSG
jgi:hypothetical protein